jgi:DNA invertase Pin-like site-specific DNA recombinase
MICQSTQSKGAAVYARYSSDLQDISSIDGQIRKAQEWAARNGFTIHEQHRFVDEAISGTKNCRPGLDQMLAAAERGEFDILLVESLSRLARSHVYASTVMMHLVYVLKYVSSVLTTVATRVIPVGGKNSQYILSKSAA